ncbi:LuxR C-terminal-related transcriptional regulator [Streptomyces djakartensis]|uniref:Transcriptional regulator n=1 Tax=Streptomyces djakartensis TaxID=68193 RepID=A0ABQ2ZF15_9ACTN|nr:LuxR C-terminal-related transcriptional regulator [Streptomyces djakartensis]GGY14830.1 transcriptional regulator [Streptomyces djakartensis]
MAATDATGTEPAPAGVDPTGDPLLRTRFVLPERPATFLRRSRLVRHLDQALVTPLTMVNGSAGAGKTLLVADWAAGLREPVAWLTTDTADQAPGVFWAYLLEALRAAGVPVAGDVGCPAEAGRVDRRTLTCLAADLESRDHATVVVLDEFDRVTSPEIAEQLRFVLRHAGGGMRLVVVTRTEPLLPLHRYRAAGELTEIRDAELAFTSEEARELLSRHGLHLPASAVRTLVGRTQGWAAGLSLCALAARQGPDPQAYLKQFEVGHSTVADFLLAEVLDRQAPGTQDLLLRISVLERFCPDLVNALTLRTDAEPVLAALRRENAFVHYLGHSWYSLHPLFAEILRAHLRERFPGLEPELRGRAARWLRRSGALHEALVQGAAAGDWEFATRAVVDDLAIGQLFTGLRAGDLSTLFARMTPEATGPAPDLVRAARELARHDLDHGLAHLRRAGEQLAGDGTGPAPGRLSCALLEALAGRLTGAPGRAERAAEQAGVLRQEVPAQLLDDHPEITALLLAHLGSARLWAGRFGAARSALSAVAGQPGGAALALPRWEALGHLALIDYLDGWPGRAEHKARAAAGQAEHYSLPQQSWAGTGPLVLAAVHIDRDELDEAQALLDAAAGTTPLVEDPVLQAGRSLTRGLLLLARGDTRAALAAAEVTVPAAVNSPWARDRSALLASAAHLAQGDPELAEKAVEPAAHHRTACAVAAARARLAAGRPEEALGLIDALPEDDRPGPAVTVRATLVRAQAALETGDLQTARRLLARALLDGRRDRLRRPFREAGPWIRPLLSTGRPRELAEGWLVPGSGRYRVPGRTPPLAPAPPAPDLPVEELSERERDVLRRLSQMMSTQEIAADLHVSANTVKTHLKSIYRKLAVGRRGDAVRRGRDLRLL